MSRQQIENIAGPALPAMDEHGNMEGMPVLGSTVGRYRLDALIGRGGMAAVYRATNVRIQTECALKILYPRADEDDHRRFTNEARLCAHLSHPNILKVQFADVWQDNRPYAVMEYMANGSVEEKLKSAGALPLAYSLSLVSLVCVALEYAHRQAFEIDGQLLKGLIHRDLKPANILFADDYSIKLADFGLAKFQGVTSHTMKGVILGSSPYMAPEQYYEWDACIETDAYSLGVTLYQMLSGKRPFPESGAGGVQDMIEAKRKAEYPPLKSVAEGVTSEAGRVIDRCLHPDPKKRYHSYGALRGDLESAIRQVSTIPPEKIVRVYNSQPALYEAAQLDRKRTFSFTKRTARIAILGLFSAMVLITAVVTLYRLLSTQKDVSSAQNQAAEIPIREKVEPIRTRSPDSVKAEPERQEPLVQKTPPRQVPKQASPPVAVQTAKPSFLQSALNEFRKKNYEQVISMLRNDNQSNKDTAAYLLISSHYRLEHIPEAISIGLAHELNDVEYHLIMALCFAKLKKTAKAEAYFEKAIVAPVLFRPSAKHDATLFRARYYKSKYLEEQTPATKKRLIDSWRLYSSLYCKQQSPECDEANAVLGME